MGRQRKGWASRTETVSLRLTPRTRYLAELAARAQRRSLSNFIEGVIDDALREVTLADDGPTVREAGLYLWDVDADARFVALATHHPLLLNFTEEVEWKRRQTDTKEPDHV